MAWNLFDIFKKKNAIYFGVTFFVFSAACASQGAACNALINKLHRPHAPRYNVATSPVHTPKRSISKVYDQKILIHHLLSSNNTISYHRLLLSKMSIVPSSLSSRLG